MEDGIGGISRLAFLLRALSNNDVRTIIRLRLSHPIEFPDTDVNRPMWHMLRAGHALF